MPTITLDELAERIEAKYEPTSIPLPDGRVVKLTVPFRLSKERKAEIKAVSKAHNDAVAKAEHAQKMRDLNNEQRAKDNLEPVELTDEDQERLTEQAEQRTLTYLRGMVRAAAEDRTSAEELLRILAGQGDDEILVLTELVTAYMKSSQVGEASPSPS